MEEMEFKDELPKENLLTKEHSDFKKFAKIIIIILLIIILLLAAGIILSFILKKDGEKGEKGEKGDKGDKGDSGDEGNKSIEEIIKEQTDKYRDAFGGEIIKNLYYAKDKVNNTFKSGGDNHREEIPIPNKGEDYKANDFNKYDLYIPYSALKENKTKGIFIIIHGGAWVGGRKEDNAFLAQIYYEHEFIVANLDYTLLSQTAPTTTNILRQIDEISACIEHLKNYLVERGFNKSELQIAVGGASAGGHLALLYSYIVEKPPLDVKFIIDIIGPVNLNIPDFLIVQKDEDTLTDFKPETIEEALKKKVENAGVLPTEKVTFKAKMTDSEGNVTDLGEDVVNTHLATSGEVEGSFTYKVPENGDSYKFSITAWEENYTENKAEFEKEFVKGAVIENIDPELTRTNNAYSKIKAAFVNKGNKATGEMTLKVSARNNGENANLANYPQKSNLTIGTTFAVRVLFLVPKGSKHTCQIINRHSNAESFDKRIPTK